MQNEIYDEKNGLTYMLCGDYYLPELALTDIEPTYGKYVMLRKSYLQEHRKAKFLLSNTVHYPFVYIISVKIISSAS